MSFWENQRNVAQTEMFTEAGNLAGRIAARRHEQQGIDDAKKLSQRLSVELDQKYEAAVRRAAETGEALPVEMQDVIPVDEVIPHVIIKTVALRELRRYVPKHPLLAQSVRDHIAREALKRYNRAGRPVLGENAPMDALAPSEKSAEQLFSTVGL